MAKLNDETHVLMDGAVKVYRRPNTRRWQATFQIGGVWVRVSTAQGDLEDAKRIDFHPDRSRFFHREVSHL